MFLLRAACALFFCTVALSDDILEPHPLSDTFINLINKKQSTWKAGRNFPLNTALGTLKKLMGVLDDALFLSLEDRRHDSELIASLPENFDPRHKWLNCPSLQEIRNQGNCGSCWAFGAVEAMTDRVCIYSNGTQHFQFSAEDLVSCCKTCGLGCGGGKLRLAWEYWKRSGIVSGGKYNTTQGCKPYGIYPCQPCTLCQGYAKTPKCKKTCLDSYNVSYEQDKRYGKHIYSIRGGEDHIKAELFINGPVESSFTVYSDLCAYKSGVYQHVEGVLEGKHAVKIMGWGVENGNKYWLIANSWGTNWGDNGFFKMLRGEDHCGIESSIIAGEPLLS